MAPNKVKRVDVTAGEKYGEYCLLHVLCEGGDEDKRE